MTEYAKENTGTIFNDGYNNNTARYSCNNVITNIEEAKDAYNKLYNVYTTYDKSTTITDSIIPSNYCITKSGSGLTQQQSCPHNLVTTNPTAVLAYTSTSGTNNVLVGDLAVYLDDCGARIRNYDNGPNTPKSYIDTKDYATKLHDVSYANLVTTRNDLDNKMNEILANNKNTILSEKQSELDASVYSTLLWTVMITSLIYYVFTKI